MDRIDCLRAFVRTLEGGSFSAAAKELGIGRASVYRALDQADVAEQGA